MVFVYSNPETDVDKIRKEIIANTNQVQVMGVLANLRDEAGWDKIVRDTTTMMGSSIDILGKAVSYNSCLPDSDVFSALRWANDHPSYRVYKAARL